MQKILKNQDKLSMIKFYKAKLNIITPVQRESRACDFLNKCISFSKHQNNSGPNLMTNLTSYLMKQLSSNQIRDFPI